MAIDDYVGLATAALGIGSLLFAMWRYRLFQGPETSSATLRNLEQTVALMSRRQQEQEEELKKLRAMRGDQHYEIILGFTHTALGELVVNKATVNKTEAPT